MNQENKNLRCPEYYVNDGECREKSNAGYIYILTNPSFPNYVKLGYDDDVDKNVRSLMLMISLTDIVTVPNNFLE